MPTTPSNLTRCTPLGTATSHRGDEARGRLAAGALRAMADYLENCRDDATSEDIDARRAQFYAALEQFGPGAEECAKFVYAALRDARFLD